MRKSLFIKYFSTSAICVLLGYTLLLVTAIPLTVRMWYSEKQDMLRNNCTRLAESAKEMIDYAEFTSSLELMSISSATSNGTVVFFADRNGHVIACSAGHDITNADSLYNKSVSVDIMNKAYNGVYTELGRLGGLYDSDYYSAATALVGRDDSIIGAVFTSYTAANQEKYLKQLVEIFIISLAVSITVIFVVMYLLVRHMVQPLKEMSEASSRIARGDFTKNITINPNRNDEVAELAKSFNSMAASLEQIEYMHSSFIVNVSHELKTPMTTISGFINGILDGTVPQEKSRYYLTVVSDEINRLSTLVNAMLNLSRIESGAMKLKCTRFCLTDTLLNTLLSMEPLINEKQLNILGVDSLPEVYVEADSDLIHQVIYNLVENAVKFSNVGGYIKFGLELADNGYNIIIENSGQGIKDDEINHIFERFYKTDKSRSIDKKGLGLGLFLVKSILSLHGGSICAESEMGKFTRFTVYLPKHAQS